MRRFAIGEYPYIGSNASDVEQVQWKGDDRLQPIILQNPASDVPFALSCIAVQSERASHPIQLLPWIPRHRNVRSSLNETRLVWFRVPLVMLWLARLKERGY